jgi:hypothetical protein
MTSIELLQRWKESWSSWIHSFFIFVDVRNNRRHYNNNDDHDKYMEFWKNTSCLWAVVPASGSLLPERLACNHTYVVQWIQQQPATTIDPKVVEAVVAER